MFLHDGGKLQYHVRVDKPDPVFAMALQQAIGGVQGEIRVALQYLFQAWGSRGPQKYRDLLLTTGTEELGHIEMLATAVALNLDGAPLEQEKAAQDPMMEASLGGMQPQHVLSSALCAMPIDASGNPFDCSHVYASGNGAADMLANVFAESTGRMLAVQLYKMTDDASMKDMLKFLIARDTMHQNQWLAAWEEMGGKENHPIPNNFPMEEEHGQYSYAFLTTHHGDAPEPEEGSWCQGERYDGRGQFETRPLEPVGGFPDLGLASSDAPVQKSQMADGAQSTVGRLIRKTEKAIGKSMSDR